MAGHVRQRLRVSSHERVRRGRRELANASGVVVSLHLRQHPRGGVSGNLEGLLARLDCHTLRYDGCSVACGLIYVELESVIVR